MADDGVELRALRDAIVEASSPQACLPDELKDAARGAAICREELLAEDIVDIGGTSGLPRRETSYGTDALRPQPVGDAASGGSRTWSRKPPPFGPRETLPRGVYFAPRGVFGGEGPPPPLETPVFGASKSVTGVANCVRVQSGVPYDDIV